MIDWICGSFTAAAFAPMLAEPKVSKPDSYASSFRPHWFALALELLSDVPFW